MNNKFLGLLTVLSFSIILPIANASLYSSPPKLGDCKNVARHISEFKGDVLSIGCGNFPLYLGQRKIDPQKEYSIDNNRRVFPCMVADGLNKSTYKDMGDNSFSHITFYHIGLCPIFSKIFHSAGGDCSTRKELYNKPNWKTLGEEESELPSELPSELFRILKPDGILEFKSLIFKDKTEFKDIHLLSDDLKTQLPLGLEVWKRHYERAGFEDFIFTLESHVVSAEEDFEPSYIQMVTRKKKSS